MSDDKKIVPRETPPLHNLGPILTLDPDVLEDRLKRLSVKDQKKLLDMINKYQAVMLSKDSHE
jgi:hypothetical protein